MRNFVLSALAGVFFLSTPLLQAKGTDPIVAKVKLTNEESILRSELNYKAKFLEKMSQKALTIDEKKQLLQAIVSETAAVQLAKKSGVSVTPAEVRQAAREAFGFTGPERDLQVFVTKQLGIEWDVFLAGQEKTLILNRFYLSSPRMEELKKVTISDADVKQYYEKHGEQFFNPEMVKISHIFFDLKGNPKGSPQEIEKRAHEVLAQIKKGDMTFEEAVRRFSEDPKTSASLGNLGYFPRQPQLEADKGLFDLFGQDFFNAIFSLNKGVVSSVIRSNLGFHIILVTEKLPRKKLALSDPVFPEETLTVDQVVRQGVRGEVQKRLFQSIAAEILDKATKQAQVEYFYSNL